MACRSAEERGYEPKDCFAGGTRRLTRQTGAIIQRRSVRMRKRTVQKGDRLRDNLLMGEETFQSRSLRVSMYVSVCVCLCVEWEVGRGNLGDGPPCGRMASYV